MLSIDSLGWYVGCYAFEKWAGGLVTGIEGTLLSRILRGGFKPLQVLCRRDCPGPSVHDDGHVDSIRTVLSFGNLFPNSDNQRRFFLLTRF